ncbi:hypothetical protein DSQ20_03835 [Nitrosarchaeum sp. AC2]|nr:hypothetical protein DSQ20_03835 [Nitrosarchaeum sp. AC2]
MALIASGLAVILVLTIAPWNYVPVLVTENVVVIAVTEHGCVGESQYGISVVMPQCDAKVGDTISASFYVPSKELNGYYDRIQDKLATVQP